MSETAAVIDLDTINYEVHPVAGLFPFIEGAAFREFVADIRTNGQREPVVLDKRGRLMDGRNRARACQVLGIDVIEKVYDGDDSPEGEQAWILSHNVHRRHLTESQRAMVAARLADMRQGARTDLPSIDGRSGVKQADAAAALKVGPASVGRANAVLKSGDADLIRAVDSGETTVSKAARQVREKSKSEASPTEAKVPSGRQQRADLIADLAAQGYSSRQMPEQVGVAEESVRQIARDFGIEIPADKAVGRTRRINSTQVVENTATALEGLITGIEQVDFAAVDPEVARQWVASFNESLRALKKFARAVEEVAS